MMRRLLFIEDEPGFRAHVSRQLMTQGWLVRSCQGGLAALQLLDEGLWVDAVVTCHHVETTNGEELAEGLRRRGFQGPIVVTTDAGLSIQIQTLLEGKANAYLAKPFDPGVLAAILLDLWEEVEAARRA